MICEDQLTVTTSAWSVVSSGYSQPYFHHCRAVTFDQSDMVTDQVSPSFISLVVDEISNNDAQFGGSVIMMFFVLL